jgi:DNA-binding HxlR family transcriptional regulator
MTLRILWELRGTPLTFRPLQESAATNPSVLNLRLKELREAHLVDRDSDGYRLTAQGKSLLATFLPLNAWADEWASSLARKNKPARRPKGSSIGGANADEPSR